MQSEIKNLAESQVEITVTLSSEELKPYLEQAAQEISREIKVEGFRPGKVPYEILVRKVGAMEIYRVAADKAVPATYPQTVVEKKIAAIGRPEIKIAKLAPGNPLVYKATVAVLPPVGLGNYKTIRATKQAIPVEEAEVNQVIEDIRRSRAKEVLADKPAAKGDKVELDYQIFLDKIPLDGGTVAKQPVVLGEGYFVPGFEAGITGLRAKEAKEFSVRFPKDYHQKNLANRDVTFQVKIHGVYQRELPAADDSFAQALGGFKTMAALKEKLTDNLRREKEVKEQARIELAVMEQLIERSTFGPIPQIMIDNELDRMIQEFKHNLQDQGWQLEEYLKQIKRTVADLKKDWREQAVKRVKIALAVAEVIKREKLEIKEAEIDQEINKITQAEKPDERIKKQANSLEFRGYLKTLLLNRKAVEFLVNQAVKK